MKVNLCKKLLHAPNFDFHVSGAISLSVVGEEFFVRIRISVLCARRRTKGRKFAEQQASTVLPLQDNN